MLEEWLRTAEMREDVDLDSFVIMPNHIHGIIVLTEHVGANCNSPNNGAYIDTPLQKTKFCSPSKTIGAIIRGFKSAATKRINELHCTPGIPIWQRNYFEHVIFNDKELDNIREYIANNPFKWLIEKEISNNFM